MIKFTDKGSRALRFEPRFPGVQQTAMSTLQRHWIPDTLCHWSRPRGRRHDKWMNWKYQPAYHTVNGIHNQQMVDIYILTGDIYLIPLCELSRYLRWYPDILYINSNVFLFTGFLRFFFGGVARSTQRGILPSRVLTTDSPLHLDFTFHHIISTLGCQDKQNLNINIV